MSLSVLSHIANPRRQKTGSPELARITVAAGAAFCIGVVTADRQTVIHTQ
jgi:hypothetical protein